VSAGEPGSAGAAAASTPRRVVVARRRGPVVSILLSLIVTAIDFLLLALALGGVRAVLAHPRAPALVAVWAVAGAALALKRPVRSQDVVESTPEPRLALVGLGLIPVLTPAIAALGERLGLWPLPGDGVLRWAGVALVALGLTLRLAAMMQLGPRFSPLVAVQAEHALETRGLYARIRHPGYLGAWLAALGAVLTFGSALGLVPLALFTWVMAGRVRKEEGLLAARFGDAWRDYRARTGAFVPRLGGAR
jgi:protein-S-isoprenylcysteine O-methyltransferase Ste14